MGTKRIILEIEEGLHKRIKDFAAKDKRTLTVVLRIMTEEMLEKLISEKETLLNAIVSNITSVVKDTEVVQDNFDQYADENVDEDTMKHEVYKHGKVLTPGERKYLNENIGKTLDDYNNIF